MKKISLAEIMGSDASRQGSSGKLSLGSLAEILGDAMPDLPRNGVGRHRLVRALQQRFGNNWRSLPGVKDLVEDFDDEVSIERRIAQIKQIKLKNKGK